MSPRVIDLVFLKKGLHDIGSEKMPASIQEAIDKADISKYSHILLGYGLCKGSAFLLSSLRKLGVDLQAY
jgi:hypothetical protein